MWDAVFERFATAGVQQSYTPDFCLDFQWFSERFLSAIIVVTFMAFIIHFYSMFSSRGSVVSSRGSNSLFPTTTPYSFILYGDNPWHSFPQKHPIYPQGGFRCFGVVNEA